MDFDYFYKEQADQFTFYRVPKVLIIDDTFSELSTDAKLLYGLLLDRVSLSANSGWFDKEGRVYVIYAIKSIMRDLHCGNKKAGNLLAELEQFGLIERKQRGQGKPWTIYVKNFSGVVSNGHLKTCQNDISRSVETTSQDMSKRHANNTNINNTEFNNTNPILSGLDVDNSDRESYRQYLYEQLEMEFLRERYPYEHELLDSIMDLMLDAICSNRKTIRIAGDDQHADAELRHAGAFHHAGLGKRPCGGGSVCNRCGSAGHTKKAPRPRAGSAAKERSVRRGDAGADYSAGTRPARLEHAGDAGRDAGGAGGGAGLESRGNQAQLARLIFSSSTLRLW